MWSWIGLDNEGIVNFIRAMVEIVILWLLFYQLYKAFHATRGARIMVGMVLCLLVVSLMAYFFEFNVLGWISTRVLAPGLAFALVVVFQPELRSGLAKLGSHPMFSKLVKIQRYENFLDTFCKAVSLLSNKRFGALFAFEREISLKNIEESGVMIDSIFSPELTMTIFYTKTALHDGGVVLSGGRMVAAGCVFPVTSKEMNDRTLGLRHRAAVGLSDETDSVVVVVSEETGAISIAVAGKLERNIDIDQLKVRLDELLNLTGNDEIKESH
ncbi:MAG: diadenylate cyclase CdaA [Akkermansia sp.]